MSDTGDKIARHNAALSCKNSGLTEVFKDVIAKAIGEEMGEEEALLMARDVLKGKVEEFGGDGGGGGSEGGSGGGGKEQGDSTTPTT
ncbi:hypothetical protein TrVE_jg6707 [Triparma verrucosa]|uniref:Uncharacterized protein n=1 Tax=Triparma verrucosa TaxID=1606542 RepID=A0A9W7FB14_9STRA|nr:hypothetical protein TrVE_jg6707 [Triparma verrucosa]